MLEQRHLPVGSTRHSWRWLPRRSPGSVLLPVWSAQVCRARLHSARGRPSSGRQDPASPHSCVRRRRSRPAHQSRAHVEAEGRDGPGDSLLVSHQARREGRSTPSFLNPLVLMLSLPSQCRAPGDLVALAVTLGPLQAANLKLGGCHQEPLAGRSPFQTQLPLCFGHIPGVKAALCWEQPLDPWLSHTWAQSLPSCCP